MTVESHVVFLYVHVEVVCPKHTSNFHKLVEVILALEERLFLENHSCEHAAQRPNIQ
jgi:hypothetical protein